MASQASEVSLASSPSNDGSHTVFAEGHPAAGLGYGAPGSVRRKRARSTTSAAASDDCSPSPSTSSSSGDAADLEGCIADMVARRDQLRKRFKAWAEQVDDATARLRCVTDNALVNQSMRLERILSDGKARIDAIVSDQDRIRGQLGSFVSMLSSAQSQIFGEGTLDPAASSAEAAPRARDPTAKVGPRGAAPTGRSPAKPRAAAPTAAAK
ncbi:hypothetical protein LPJ61_003489 [Coemansia biformis]|uniref:Uncharacterized protein n=1 Tax=Coemansia biformis TaxID=1286918 RepID=A0A9W8CXM6_9FUNG|nr:hypothetical protein LPJ61_003489 [Coemansia biformis]